MRAKLVFSTIVAAILFAGGIVLTERRGDPAKVISGVERRLAELFQPKTLPTPPSLKGKFGNIIQFAPDWSEVQLVTSGLTWQNQRIAEAKALIQYENRPENVYSDDWNTRAATASRAWEVEESFDFAIRRAQSATIAGAIGFGVSMVFLVACSWLWGALLRRLRELSNAIRGRE